MQKILKVIIGFCLTAGCVVVDVPENCVDVDRKDPVQMANFTYKAILAEDLDQLDCLVDVEDGGFTLEEKKEEFRKDLEELKELELDEENKLLYYPEPLLDVRGPDFNYYMEGLSRENTKVYYADYGTESEFYRPEDPSQTNYAVRMMVFVEGEDGKLSLYSISDEEVYGSYLATLKYKPEDLRPAERCGELDRTDPYEVANHVYWAMEEELINELTCLIDTDSGEVDFEDMKNDFLIDLQGFEHDKYDDEIDITFFERPLLDIRDTSVYLNPFESYYYNSYLVGYAERSQSNSVYVMGLLVGENDFLYFDEIINIDQDQYYSYDNLDPKHLK